MPTLFRASRRLGGAAIARLPKTHENAWKGREQTTIFMRLNASLGPLKCPVTEKCQPGRAGKLSGSGRDSTITTTMPITGIPVIGYAFRTGPSRTRIIYFTVKQIPEARPTLPRKCTMVHFSCRRGNATSGHCSNDCKTVMFQMEPPAALRAFQHIRQTSNESQRILAKTNDDRYFSLDNMSVTRTRSDSRGAARARVPDNNPLRKRPPAGGQQYCCPKLLVWNRESVFPLAAA